MKLMRHSDINLTVKVYTDAGVLPARAAIEKLPDFGALAEPEACSHGRSHDLDFAGQFVTLPVTTGTCESIEEAPANIGPSHRVALTVTTGHKMRLVLGGGLEPPRLSAHAPQTCVSAISPPEHG